MATTNQTVTAVSATVKYSNKDDANRVYDISANARIENGGVNNFEGGEVKKRTESSETMDGMNSIATFDTYGEKNLNLYLRNVDESDAIAVLPAIYAFMSNVKAIVNANIVIA